MQTQGFVISSRAGEGTHQLHWHFLAAVQTAQSLSLSPFPSFLKETCKQSHSSCSHCAFPPCCVLIHLTFQQLWAGKKQNTRDFKKTQEIHFTNGEPLE